MMSDEKEINVIEAMEVIDKFLQVANDKIDGCNKMLTKAFKTFEYPNAVAERIHKLESCHEEIERVALVSEGVEWYAMMARKGLDGDYIVEYRDGGDPQP